MSFHYKNEKQKINKTFTKVFTDENFANAAICIIEKAYESLINHSLLPNLTQKELSD